MSEFVSYQIIKNDSSSWVEVLDQFEDANIYQSEEFTRSSVGGSNYEQFILKSDDKIIAAALIRLKIISKLNRGVAYIRWAPLWQSKNSQVNKTKTFELALKYLKIEYVKKRKLVLRIMSGMAADINQDQLSTFKKMGFHLFRKDTDSIRIDLTKGEEELRNSFRKKWRYSLKQSEKKELSVSIGSDNTSFNTFLKLYKQMHNRKKFVEYVDVESFKTINHSLPDNLKMQVFTAFKNDEPVSSMVVSALGKYGIYLLGASSPAGLKLYSSYLLQWEVIKWMKSRGIHSYDLGGIDKDQNPGVYTFKSGMGGEEFSYLGGYEISESLISKKIVQIGELFKKS